ncbi:MAG: RluA family pseudouridine synthase [Oscillospiraceae bacterium]
MKSFIISANDSNQRLDKFITKSLPNLPKALMYKYIRTKRIKINNKRAEISTRLNIGDVVDMYINDEFFEKPAPHYDFLHAPKKLDILYEDENIMLLDKKVGLLAHPDENEYTDTLITRVKRYLYENGSYIPEDENSFAPALVNRIDRNTGGIVIAAKNAQSLRILNAKMKYRELQKFYLCVLHGTLDKKEDTLEGFLVKDEDKNKVFVYKTMRENAKQIKTHYRVLDSYNNMSLIEVELLTGRTHQIRAHFASIGHPLLGDGKYGKNALNKELGYKKQFLYSYKLVFDFKTDADILEYLNHKEFEVEDVWFKREFFNRSL